MKVNFLSAKIVTTFHRQSRHFRLPSSCLWSGRRQNMSDSGDNRGELVGSVDLGGRSKTSDADEGDKSITEVSEGKAVIRCDPTRNIFYNPIQEFNRDISILGIQTHINMEKKKEVKILEAMAASGIRSIRYALEIQELSKVVANDYSKSAIQSIQENSKLNGTEDLVEPSFNDACAMMREHQNKGFVVDLDPYGTPAPFLDAAVQSVQDGGILLVTATDMAVLAGGNAAESCFAKYGAMSLKTKACQEMALRIIVHAVQSSANRYGRCVIPLLSLKIDFYVRLMFKVIKSAEKAKESSLKTSLVYQCQGCRSLSFQPMAIKKNARHYGFAHGPPVAEKCGFCQFGHHVGGPIWTGSIQDKSFIESMSKTLHESYSYVNTFDRIEGMLSLVEEEVDVPLLYDISELCSVLKASTIPLTKLRSALLNLGYEVSLSHTAPNTLKTTAPNSALWDILKTWRLQESKNEMKSGTAGYNIMQQPISTPNISFEMHPDANPSSRQNNFLRYQVNPTRNWGPGVRNAFKGQATAENKRTSNQGKRKSSRNQLNNVEDKSDDTSPNSKVQKAT